MQPLSLLVERQDVLCGDAQSRDQVKVLPTACGRGQGVSVPRSHGEQPLHMQPVPTFRRRLSYL